MYIDLKRILTLFILGCIFSNDGVLAQAIWQIEYYDSGRLKSVRNDSEYYRYTDTELSQLAYKEYYVTLKDFNTSRYNEFTELEFQSLIGTIKDKIEVTFLTDKEIVSTNVKITEVIKRPYSKSIEESYKLRRKSTDEYYNSERVRNIPIRISFISIGLPSQRLEKGYFSHLSEYDWNKRYYDGVYSCYEGGRMHYEKIYISGVSIEKNKRMGCYIDRPFTAAEDSNAMVLDKESYIYNLSEFLKVFLYDVLNADYEYFKAYSLDNDQYSYSNNYLFKFLDAILADTWKKIPAFPFGKEGLEAELVFKSLEGGQIAVSRGMNDDTKVILEVDPVKWATASTPKKWYIIYHELGHDVLNLNHGEGGRMMFNFPVGEYTWDDFFKDRDYMFKYVFDKHYSK